jgi:flavin reductase ActVB
MSHEPVSSAAFREALARFASGVTVVTADGASGPVGLTATAFSSVSLAPPLILVCVARRSSVHDAVVEAERFGVSILADHQRWIAEQFARSGVDRFRGVHLRYECVPLIEGAVARLACCHHACHAAGDHSVLIGEVLTATVIEADPLVHYWRRFGGFAAELRNDQTLAGAAVSTAPEPVRHP